MYKDNPIKLIVHSAVLQQSRKFKFQYTSSGQDLHDLTEILKIEKLTTFSFKGKIIQSSKMNFILKATFNATLIQLCVVSLNPIKTKIIEDIERYYSLKSKKNNVKQVSVNFDVSEIEEISNTMNLGDIMLEALSLKIPLYPKKKNARFEGVTITEAGLRPLDKTLNNPFIALKKLR